MSGPEEESLRQEWGGLRTRQIEIQQHRRMLDLEEREILERIQTIHHELGRLMLGSCEGL